MKDRARLPRLDSGFYKGRAVGHWTMAMEDRATGWLDECFHLRLREILVHVGVRYHLVFPVYCLMPDHAHFLVMGCRAEAECQRAAFENLAGYILQNPLRAGLLEQVEAYAFCGSVVPGYPSLDPRQDRFWESFWLAYESVANDA